MKVLTHLILVLIIAAALVAGLIAGLAQFKEGLGATALHEPGVWGLYVVCFAYFTGLGAGALTVASVAIRSGREQYRPVARAGSVVALAALMLAGIFITADLGRPEKAYLMVTEMQLRSPLFWDFVILNALIGVAALYTFVPLRARLIEKGGAIGSLLDSKLKASVGASRIVGLLAGPMIVIIPVLYLVTARVFSSLQARPQWHTASLAPTFLVSALLSGLAAVAIVTYLVGGFRAPDTGEQAVRVIAGGLLVIIVVDVVLFFVPFVTMQQFDTSAQAGGVGHLSGEMVFELLVGLLLPFVLIAATRRRARQLLATPCVLILVGVLVKRWHIVISGSLHRNLPLPASTYSPNGVELGVSAGIIGFGLLVVYVLMLLMARPVPALDGSGGTAARVRSS